MQMHMRDLCKALSGCKRRYRARLPHSHAQNSKLGIREIAKPRPLRPPEIFAPARFAIDAYNACDRAVGVENNDRLAAPQQIASDRAGTSDEIGNLAAEGE